MRYGSVLFRDGKGGRFEIRINEAGQHYVLRRVIARGVLDLVPVQVRPGESVEWIEI